MASTEVFTRIAEKMDLTFGPIARFVRRVTLDVNKEGTFAI